MDTTTRPRFYTPEMGRVDARRGHAFVTATEIADTPRLYATERVPMAQKRATVKFFSPSLTWYMVEVDPAEGLAFGYVENLADPWCSEWGYFSLVELGELSVFSPRSGLPVMVERDLHFDGRMPKTAR